MYIISTIKLNCIDYYNCFGYFRLTSYIQYQLSIKLSISTSFYLYILVILIDFHSFHFSPLSQLGLRKESPLYQKWKI